MSLQRVFSYIILLWLLTSAAEGCEYPVYVNSGWAGWPPCLQKIEVHVSLASFSDEQFNAISGAFTDWENQLNNPFGLGAFVHFEMHHDNTTVAGPNFHPFDNAHQVSAAPPSNPNFEL